MVPAADALVFPSTFPEAFGMVAAEAAAAGVLPVGAAHSGHRRGLPRAGRGAARRRSAPLVSFALGDGAVEAIAERLNAWFALAGGRAGAGAGVALRETVARLWSWEGVAGGVIAASAGDLDELADLPASASDRRH